nr:hypothetical protein [uncultured Carboxylicivirga sp.]
MRKAVMLEGKSKMNATLAYRHVDEIENLLNTYGYKSNELMASFWQRKKYKIMEILPGANSRAHRSMISEFNQLDFEAQVILP